MAPEKYIPGEEILPESERIADTLLEIQEEVNRSADERHLQLLEGVRGRMGYDELPDEDHSQGLIDTRIAAKSTVVTPRAVATVLPLSLESASTTRSGREDATNIINGSDDRLLVIAGPCSIHDPVSALEYAEGLIKLSQAFVGELRVLMRAYFEKPRTELGWKGFTYDPYLDGSNRFSTGLVATRMLMCRITGIGLPIATEPLNALTPQYGNALVTYSGVGARSVTDQTARERASGLSPVVGFKNAPSGELGSAVEAVVAGSAPHDFLGVDEYGMTSQIATRGNETAHVILRGTSTGPNYSATHVAETSSLMAAKGLSPRVVIDFSHGNSGKKHENQIIVARDVAGQIAIGERAIRGVLVESHLVAGRQPHSITERRELRYGQSITDACVDLDTTEEMFEILANAVQERRAAA